LICLWKKNGDREGCQQTFLSTTFSPTLFCQKIENFVEDFLVNRSFYQQQLCQQRFRQHIFVDSD
jgi:hypothetical protein